MEDAEKDEGLRLAPPGRQGNGDRAAGNQRQAAEIRLKPESATGGEHQVDANHDQKGAGDQPGKDFPTEVVDDIDADQLRRPEVEGSVVDDHRQDGDAADHIKRGNPRSAVFV
jgi:hypothetical protein